MLDFRFVQWRSEQFVEHALAVHRAIVGRETAVFIIRHMNGIVRHIKIEWLTPGDRHSQSLDSLTCQGLSQEDTVGIVSLQAGYMEHPLAILPLAQIAGRASCCTASDVHIEAHRKRISARRGLGCEMSLSAMDGVVSMRSEQLRQWSDKRGTRRVVRRGSGFRLNAVAVPLR